MASSVLGESRTFVHCGGTYCWLLTDCCAGDSANRLILASFKFIDRSFPDSILLSAYDNPEKLVVLPEKKLAASFYEPKNFLIERKDSLVGAALIYQNDSIALLEGAVVVSGQKDCGEIYLLFFALLAAISTFLFFYFKKPWCPLAYLFSAVAAPTFIIAVQVYLLMRWGAVQPELISKTDLSLPLLGALLSLVALATGFAVIKKVKSDFGKKIIFSLPGILSVFSFLWMLGALFEDSILFAVPWRQATIEITVLLSLGVVISLISARPKRKNETIRTIESKDDHLRGSGQDGVTQNHSTIIGETPADDAQDPEKETVAMNSCDVPGLAEIKATRTA